MKKISRIFEIDGFQDISQITAFFHKYEMRVGVY